MTVGRVQERRDPWARLRALDRRSAAVLAGGLAAIAFALAFWLGWTSDVQAERRARAVPLAARPTAVEVVRLSAVARLPALRPASRPRPAQTTTQRRAAPAPPKAKPKQPKPAPKPVTIVGSG